MPGKGISFSAIFFYIYENRYMEPITIQATINAPVEKVWSAGHYPSILFSGALQAMTGIHQTRQMI